MQGYLGWRKLAEWREVMKVLFGKRQEGMEESTGEDGGDETKRGQRNRVVGREGGFEEKIIAGFEVGSVGSLKIKITT